jgi:hypothetical protein
MIIILIKDKTEIMRLSFFLFLLFLYGRRQNFSSFAVVFVTFNQSAFPVFAHTYDRYLMTQYQALV